MLLAYWKRHATSIRQDASQTTNSNPLEKFLNQPGLSSGYLQTHSVAKKYSIWVHTGWFHWMQWYLSFLPVTDKHGRLVGTYTNQGRFLCSITHLRKLKKDSCLNINILGKWELQTIQELIAEEYSRASQKTILTLEKNLLWNQDFRHFIGWKTYILLLWKLGCTHTAFLLIPEEKQLLFIS